MHPSHHAANMPEKLAIIDAETRESMDYGTLEARSNQCAHALRALGLRRGDGVATLFDNGPEVLIFGLAAQRTGLFLTSISNKLSVADAAYILRDCDARLLLASDAFLPFALSAAAEAGGVRLFGWTSGADGARAWCDLAATLPTSPVDDECAGTDMLYSSGTTGRPKGVKFPLPEGGIDQPTPLMNMGTMLYGMGTDTIYLSTSPLYHAAPLRWAMTIHRLGGTVILMRRFDAEAALALIEEHRVTHATFVPTHFVRMLKLPDAVRQRYRHTSLRAAIHAAAPCPVPVKQAMIDWWGPVLHEYYSGTEQCGITALSSHEWLERPGSVGRAVLGRIRITDGRGKELPVGAEGDVCFSDGPRFEYHKDPEKTAGAYDANGWATLGDVGRVDQDGYLFLTDRKSFMIISGGVNIYPQEIENCLVIHPDVADAAVIGVPDEEMGEKVLAVIQPAPGVVPGDDLAERLRRHVRAALGGVKTPRAFAFRDTLPREATGKLMKRHLVAEYRQRAFSPIPT